MTSNKNFRAMGEGIPTEPTHEDEHFVYFGNSLAISQEAMILRPGDWATVLPTVANGATVTMTSEMSLKAETTVREMIAEQFADSDECD